MFSQYIINPPMLRDPSTLPPCSLGSTAVAALLQFVHIDRLYYYV